MSCTVAGGMSVRSRWERFEGSKHAGGMSVRSRWGFYSGVGLSWLQGWRWEGPVKGTMLKSSRQRS